MPCDRRTYLGLLTGTVAATAAGAAGCLVGGDSTQTNGPGDANSPATGTSPTGPGEGTSPPGTVTRTDGATTDSAVSGTATGNGTGSPGGTPAASATPTGGTVALTWVEPGPDAPLRVYPTDLRSTLRQAAESDDPVRTTGGAFVYAPRPLLPGFDAVELVDLDGDASGTYAVDCQGGTRYHVLVGAEEATPPGDATVTPVSALSGARRDLALAAVRDEGPRVYPETALGEWVRTAFFGSYFSHEGTTYRGTEVQQTDAAFFSTEAWYVLRLTPADDAGDPVTLDLSPVDDAAREVLDPLLEDRSKHQERAEADLDAVPDGLSAFLEETDRVLTHASSLGITLER